MDNNRTKTIKYIAVGGEDNGFGLLSQKPIIQLKKINEYLTMRWRVAEASKLDDEKAFLWEISGCLDKLNCVFLQACRIKEYMQNLTSDERLNTLGNNNSLFLKADIVLSDFEAFLLQSRASLDRLATFLGKQYKNKCDNLKGIQNIIEEGRHNQSENDLKLLKILKEEAQLIDILVDNGGKKSLRSWIAHYKSVSELLENCVAVYNMDNRFLILDCEYNKIPLFKTTKRTTSSVAFLVLNALSLFCSIDLFERKEYELNWSLKSVAVSDFISSMGMSLAVVKRMTPDGFEIRNIKVKNTILDNTIQLGVER